MKSKVSAFLRFHGPFLLLLCITLLVRLWLLVAGKVPIDNDDAQHGLMAIHFYRLQHIYLYEIAEPIHGGAVVEAALAALGFWIGGGISQPALQASPLLLSLLGLVSFYAVAYRWFGRTAALWSAGLFAFATPLAWVNLKLRGGYLLVLVLTPWLLDLEDRILCERSVRPRTYVLLGCLCGVGVWTLEIMVPFAAAALLLWAVRGRTRGWGWSPLYVLGGVLAGYSPSIVYNLTHHYANWKYLLGTERIHLIPSLIAEGSGGQGPVSILIGAGGLAVLLFGQALTFLPRFFEPDNMWSFRPTSVVSYAQAAIVWSIVAYWIVRMHRKMWALLASIATRSCRVARGHREEVRISLIVLSLAVFLLFFILNPHNYLYLVPLYPWVPLLVTLLARDLRGRGRWRGWVGGGILAAVVLCSAWGYGLLPGQGREYGYMELFYDGARHELYNVTDDDDVGRAVDFLESHGFERVYTPHFMNFLLQYLSEDRIAAASLYWFLGDRYPDMTRVVRGAERFAIVSYRESPVAVWISAELARLGVPIETRHIGHLLIFYPLTREELFGSPRPAR